MENEKDSAKIAKMEPPPKQRTKKGKRKGQPQGHHKVVESDLIQERGKCQVAETDAVSIDEDIFIQLAEAVYHRDEYKAALDKEKQRTKVQLLEIEELQQIVIKMKYSSRE